MNETPDLKSALALDLDSETKRIAGRIRELMASTIKRRGIVVAISGGVDSAVTAALCVQALGAGRVFGLLLPEQDSSASSEDLGSQVAEGLGIDYSIKNITSTLESIGCYEARDDAIRSLFPDYDGTWPNKIVIDGGTEGRINHFRLVVQKPDGKLASEFLPRREYLSIVAATNFKQRVRKTLEYFHADRLNYAVAGTPNRLEYDQGFFVKGGDGLADLKPIAHLYKTQVYALARHLGLPEGVCNAVPSTDTYSLSQGQDEFYFALPYDRMDLALWGFNHDIDAGILAPKLGISEEKLLFVYQDIRTKRNTTRYLHMPAQLIEGDSSQ